MIKLYYIHDPMCSWCWAFDPIWQKICQKLPENILLQTLLGGLAPDTDEPMSSAMQQQIAGYWRTIEKTVPGTRFNYAFWTMCSPRRSTYPACRAVIAARNQHLHAGPRMINAIQHAYYLHAQNPSEKGTLLNLAEHLGLDPIRFETDLDSESTQSQLAQEIQSARLLGANGFPSLVLEENGTHQLLPLDYNDENVTLDLLVTKY